MKIMFHADVKQEYFEHLLLEVYFTSEPNSFGIEHLKFMDGKLSLIKMISQQQVTTYLKPKMTKVLTEKTGCREENFFNLFQHEFVENVRRICGENETCRPTELPSN